MSKSKLPEPSKIPATPMRMVLVYAGGRWPGVLPGMVIRPIGDGTYNVMVFGDDSGDVAFHFTQAHNIQIFDALSDEQRSAMLEENPSREWCEWNSHQVGQAAKTEDVSAKLAGRIADIEKWVYKKELNQEAMTACTKLAEEIFTKVSKMESFLVEASKGSPTPFVPSTPSA